MLYRKIIGKIPVIIRGNQDWGLDSPHYEALSYWIPKIKYKTKVKYKTVEIIAYDGMNWNDVKVKSSDIDNLVNSSYQHRFLPIWNKNSGKKHLIDISNVREIVIEENEEG